MAPKASHLSGENPACSLVGGGGGGGSACEGVCSFWTAYIWRIYNHRPRSRNTHPKHLSPRLHGIPALTTRLSSSDKHTLHWYDRWQHIAMHSLVPPHASFSKLDIMHDWTPLTLHMTDFLRASLIFFIWVSRSAQLAAWGRVPAWGLTIT